MDEDLHKLDGWIQALLMSIQPAQRRAVNRRVAFDLRRSQSSRIAAQRNPDGSAYTPRKNQKKRLRSKKGTIKRRAMFAKLRTQRYLKVDADADSLSVGFRGRAAVIAIVHQHGEEAVSSAGKRFRMPVRELLGLTDAELEMIQEAYLQHLAARE